MKLCAKVTQLMKEMSNITNSYKNLMCTVVPHMYRLT